jgi:diguanylate cyclase (GGDEF)-like protein
MICSAFLNAPTGQAIINKDNAVLAANKKMCELFSVIGNAFHCAGTWRNEPCGKNKKCLDCVIRILIAGAIKNNSGNKTLPFWYFNGNKLHCRWLDIYVEPLTYNGKRYVLLNMADVTKHVKKNIKMRSELEIDRATGALNKYSLMGKIDSLLNRTDSVRSFTICMIDLDDFKYLNDTYGHLAGDKVLNDFCNVSKKTIRKYDIFGRYGGEEFVFVFVDTKPDEAVKIIQKIQYKFKQCLFKSVHEPLSFSCGLLYADNKKFNDGMELIGHVDKLLYKAKEKGKNRIVSSDCEYYFSV